MLLMVSIRKKNRELEQRLGSFRDQFRSLEHSVVILTHDFSKRLKKKLLFFTERMTFLKKNSFKKQLVFH